MKGFIVGLVAFLLVIWGGWHLFAHGWHHQTGAGDHTGYITAVETSGLFWKTNTVYLKTNTTSTQEDAYCVVDQTVFDSLQAASVGTTHVNVHFINWFMAGFEVCGNEEPIITSVEVLPN